MNRALIFALLVMGFTSLMVQVVLVRELLVDFLGNELSVGIILGSWLLMEGLGSWIAGRFNLARPVRAYVLLQVAVSALLPLAVAESRIARSIAGLVPGEGAGLGSILYLSFLILSPIALCDGAQFAVGSAIFSGKGSRATSIGSVYVLEALGSTIAGLLATYVLIPYSFSMASAFVVSLANLASGVLILAPQNAEEPGRPGSRHRPLMIFTILLLCTASLATVLGGPGYLERTTLAERWRGYDLLESANSVYGNIAVVRQGEQLTFFVDGLPAITSPVPDLELSRDLVHSAMLHRPDAEKVLVLGGGVSGILTEVLRYDPSRVVYVEQDPLLIRMVRKYPTNITAAELSDPRVCVQETDGRRFLAQTTERFDVVVMNLPYPSSLTLDRFYTAEFYRLLASRMTENGVLALPTPGAPGYLSDEEREMNRCILEALGEAFTSIKVIPGSPNIILASKGRTALSVSIDELCERSRSLGMDGFMPSSRISYLFDEMRAEWFNRSLESVYVRPNLDLRPSAVYYSLCYWTSQFSPRLLPLLRLMGKTTLPAVLITVAILGGLLFALRRPLTSRGFLPIPVVVATTGTFGMTIETIVILVYQSFFGYLYHEIGLVLTSFMLGLAAGGSIVNYMIAKDRRPPVIYVEIGVIAFCVGFAMLIHPLLILSSMPGTAFISKIALLTLSALSGMMVGVQFPLSAAVVLSTTDRLSKVAGSLYGWDLLGAVVGSLMTSIVLVPLVGVVATCISLASLKVLSMALLYVSPVRWQ